MSIKSGRGKKITDWIKTLRAAGGVSIPVVKIIVFSPFFQQPIPFSNCKLRTKTVAKRLSSWLWFSDWLLVGKHRIDQWNSCIFCQKICREEILKFVAFYTLQWEVTIVSQFDLQKWTTFSSACCSFYVVGWLLHVFLLFLSPSFSRLLVCCRLDSFAGHALLMLWLHNLTNRNLKPKFLKYNLTYCNNKFIPLIEIWLKCTLGKRHQLRFHRDSGYDSAPQVGDDEFNSFLGRNFFITRFFPIEQATSNFFRKVRRFQLLYW